MSLPGLILSCCGPEDFHPLSLSLLPHLLPSFPASSFLCSCRNLLGDFGVLSTTLKGLTPPPPPSSTLAILSLRKWTSLPSTSSHYTCKPTCPWPFSSSSPRPGPPLLLFLEVSSSCLLRDSITIESLLGG